MLKLSTFVRSGLVAFLFVTAAAAAAPAWSQAALDEVMDQLVAEAIASNLELAIVEASVA